MANKKFLNLSFDQFLFKRMLISCFILLFAFLISSVIYNQYQQLTKRISSLNNEKNKLEKQLATIAKELNRLKNQDQYKINQQLAADIKKIETTYNSAVTVYEDLLKLKEISKKTDEFDKAFTENLTYLAQRNYASAEAGLKTLTQKIASEREKIVASFVIPQNVTQSNTPPASGYQRQVVKTDIGEFLVDIVSADLGSTRVIVDTAADSDCRNDCPVLSLGDYVSRNGGYAGINGSYFCPASYPSCADKKNAYDTLAMNKNKVYFNSENNVYSTVPAVIFLPGSIRFVTQSLQWGRDTSPDGVLANQPLLVFNGNVVFGGDDEIKRAGKGSRSFVGNNGNTVYIGVVHNVNAAEMARALSAMGIQNALNLDSGGSTALWYGGYKVGPGRNIPNAIVFVRK